MENKKSILLVEDDEVILSLLKELLENHNYLVDCAHNGVQALRSLRDNPDLHSLILLDLMMPIMNGLQFIEEQSKDSAIRSIPVIAMSADNQLKNRLSGPNIVGYFTKPIKIDFLIETIHRHCSA